MSETGSPKFKCEQLTAKLSRFAGFDELNSCRSKLLHLGMVGVDANGVSFGNLSVRAGATSQFYITGTGTGSFAELTPADFAKVVAYDFARNWVQYEGSRVASSESLTHAAVYEADSTVGAVIHCHDLKLWSALSGKVRATPIGVDYGTPETARAVQRLFQNTDLKDQKILVMSGHHGGLIAFGKDSAQALEVLLSRRSV